MNFGTFQGPGLGIPPRNSSGLFFEELIVTSSTWIAPVSTRYTIFSIGGGGSGARRANGGASTATASVSNSGGGAGGLAIKSAFLPAGTRLTITIGAGGATVAANNNGSAGGNTIVTGAGLSLVGGGGGGGITSSGTTSASAAGGVGGSASGGDFNIVGGAGGAASSSNNAASAATATTGGGAVGWFGTGYAGGEAVANATVEAGRIAIAQSGGAGVGGAGGTATATCTAGVDVTSRSAGGSSIQKGNDNGARTTGLQTLGFSQTSLLVPVGDGGNGSGPLETFPPGGGTGGSPNEGRAGIFAGQGANGTGNSAAGLGGGSGAMTGGSFRGGDGLVVIMWGSPV